MGNRISLELDALEVCNANAKPPFIFQLPPWKGREVLEEAQNTPVHMYPADVTSIDVNTGKWGGDSDFYPFPFSIPSYTASDGKIYIFNSSYSSGESNAP